MILANQGLHGKGHCLYLENRHQLWSYTSLFKQHWPQLLLDHKQTMGYLLVMLVASTYVPLIGASCWICYFNQPWIWMITGCVITHKYSHHVTLFMLLGYMGVGFVWVNCLFDYTMTNKLIFIHQTLVQPCVPTANDEIPWDAGHWILHNNFSTPCSGSQLTSSKIPYNIGRMGRIAGLDKIWLKKITKVFEMYLNCIWNIKYFLNVFKYKYKYFSFWNAQIQIQIQILEKKYLNTFKYKYFCIWPHVWKLRSSLFHLWVLKVSVSSSHNTGWVKKVARSFVMDNVHEQWSVRHHDCVISAIKLIMKTFLLELEPVWLVYLISECYMY